MIYMEREKKLLRQGNSIHLVGAIVFTFIFIAFNPSMGAFHMIATFLASMIAIPFISPLRFYIKKKWNSFFTQSQIKHEFKEETFTEQDLIIENLCKRILFQLYCKKNSLKAIEYSFYNKNYSKDELSLNNLIGKLDIAIQTYPLKAKKVYQQIYTLCFQKDALVSYAMTHQEKHFILFLISHNLLIFSKEDMEYLNLGHNVHKSVATLLFQKEVYEILPQEIRHYLLTHISQKSKLLFEENALLLEKEIQNQQLSQTKYDEEKKSEIFYELFLKMKPVIKYSEESLNMISANLKFIYENYCYLSVDNQLEFNHIYQKMLPTYIELFISKNFEDILEFEKGIKLIELTLEEYKKSIIENNANDFQIYHQYLTNKLNHKTMSSEA